MKFAPRRSHRNTAFFYLVLAVLIIVGFLLIRVDRATGYTFASIFSVLLVLVIAQTARIRWSYTVDDDGVTVRKTFGATKLPATLIGEVTLIDGAAADELLRPYRLTVDEDSRAERIAKAYELQRELARIVALSSVPIISGDSRKGMIMNLGSTASARAVYILLTLVDGRRHILSPADPEAAAEAVRKLIQEKPSDT